MAGVAEVERETEAPAGGHGAPPAGLLRREPDDAGGAARVQCPGIPGLQPARLAEDLEQHVEVIASARGRKLVDEALDDEAEDVGARRPPGPAPGAPVEGRLLEAQVVDQSGREDAGPEAPAADRAAPVGERDEMVPKSGNPPLPVQRSFELVKAPRPEQVVRHVVFTRPLELDRTVDARGDRRRFAHEIVVQPAAETAAAAGLVHRDAVRSDAQRVRDVSDAAMRGLGGRPEFDGSVAGPGHAVLRFELRVAGEVIGVEGLEPLRAGGERGVDVARLRHPGGAGPVAELSGLGDGVGPAIARGGALVPVDLELPLRRERCPRGVGHDGDTGHQFQRIAVSFQRKHILYTRQRFDFTFIERSDPPALGGAFLVHGVLHARQRLIDAEQRLATHQGFVVDPGDAPAEQTVLVGRLQRQRARVRHRHRGGSVRELRVAQPCAGPVVHDVAVARGKFGRRHAQTHRGRADQHGAGGRAGRTQQVPVHADRVRAASYLRAVDRRVDRRLGDCHVLPGRIQFLGHDHRQRRLDALADLRVLGVERDALGVDAQKPVRVQCATRRGGPQAGEREHQPAADQARELEEVAPPDLRDGGRLHPVHRRFDVDRKVPGWFESAPHDRPPSARCAAAVLIAWRMRR